MIDGLRGGDHDDEIAGFYFVAGFGGFAVDFDELVIDQSLDGAAGEPGNAIFEELVDSSGLGFGGSELEMEDVGFLGGIGSVGGVEIIFLRGDFRISGHVAQLLRKKRSWTRKGYFIAD
jgi:hypothetical protein